MGTVATLSRLSEEKFEEMEEELSYPYKFKSGEVYLDKTWDVLAFILTGAVRHLKDNILSEINNPMENFVISKNEYMTEYIRYSYPVTVKMINAELEKISDNKFKFLYEKRDYTQRGGLAMYANVYPRNQERSLRNLLHYFRELKQFYKIAAENDEYVVTVIGS